MQNFDDPRGLGIGSGCEKFFMLHRLSLMVGVRFHVESSISPNIMTVTLSVVSAVSGTHIAAEGTKLALPEMAIIVAVRTWMALCSCLHLQL